MQTTVTGTKEIRSAPGTVRAESLAGKTYLTGYAATFGQLSRDLGGWQERIMPGAFSRCLRSNPDVRYLINHDPNKVLGRTQAGTLTLRTDSHGLAFRCELANTTYARDLAESVQRGDVNECSFGFVTRDQKWLNEDDPDDLDDPGSQRCVRELYDVDLQDVSTVTFPAYPGTATQLSSRALFPAGVPAEVRDNIRRLQGNTVLKSDEWYARRAREILMQQFY
jgi:HK97 family phage prohead protease